MSFWLAITAAARRISRYPWPTRAARGEEAWVALCDVDIVNPYFRAADAVRPMRAAGIEVVVPETANTNLDTPLIPGTIQAAFTNRFDHVIFDVGGDDAGAIVLGTYRDKIAGTDIPCSMSSIPTVR